jgi:ABC-2 type transport system permease protein
MRATIAIFAKEIRIYFTTPVAYVVLSVFAIVSSLFFLSYLSSFQQQYLTYSQMRPELLQYLNFTDGVLKPVFYTAAVLMIFVMPLVCMRLIAEERRAWTFELLLSCPVTSLQIAAGKFLAASVVVLAMVSLMALYPLLVWAYATLGGPSWATVFTGLLGLFLLGLAFASLGLFISSLTSSQIVAAIITLCVFLLLWMAGGSGRDEYGITRDVLMGISAIEHIHGFTEGVIDLKDVVYYLSLVFLGLFLTRRVLEARRWQ